MLAKIITKTLNNRIIDYLLNKQDTVTSVAKNIKSKKSNVSKILKKLYEENIVTKEIIGKSHCYNFNYLHPEAKEIINFLFINRANQLNTRLKNLPKFIDAYLKSILKNNYIGLIIFGSALTEKYKDIDIFIIVNKSRRKKQIIKNLRLINEKLSPIIGTKKELEEGFKNNDLLYLNIINGISFNCLDIITDIKYKYVFLKRKDIEERFVIGYREILNCKKFKDDKQYIKIHLEKGIFDIIYSTLNYKQTLARNDREAELLFKKTFKHKLPKSLKQAELFIDKMKGVIFY